MRKTFVLTFIAEDRPGLVEKLSQTVTEHGGNWLESRMAHLAEKFAGIARVEIADARASSFRRALADLESDGFRLTIEPTTAEAPAPGALLTVDLVGPDHPGIVREISRCLAERGVSVEEMETDVRESPMGGGPLFYAHAHVRVPSGLDQSELRGTLEQLSAALMVDITLGQQDAPASGSNS